MSAIKEDYHDKIEAGQRQSIKKKGKIFYGGRFGKLRLAQDISETKKTVWISARHPECLSRPFAFECVNSDTELIIIDDLPATKLNEVLWLVSSEKLIVNKMYTGKFEVDVPEIIVTTNCDESDVSGASIEARFDVIRFNSMDDYFIQYEKYFGYPHSEL